MITFDIFLGVSVLGECSTKDVQIMGLYGNDGSGKTLSFHSSAKLTHTSDP